MAKTEAFSDARRLTRRLFVKLSVAAVGFIAVWENLVTGGRVLAQTNLPGWPLADEPVEATLKRLFGNRVFTSGEGKIKMDLPAIAEDGGNVAISVDVNLPVSGANRVNHIYIISDKNRRPMLAKFSLSADSGRAVIATSIRLATSTDVRAVVEMNDGTLYAVTKHVRVTISGCDLPPSG
ncbi:MAG: thiosulfate oxidation carrier protein SoxY [Candidatus Binatia bacterium]